MAETIKPPVAGAADFGDQPASLVHERYSHISRFTFPELDAIREALHAMRVGEIENDTRPDAEALRALLASADAKILAMRESRQRRQRRAIDLDIDAALIAIDAAIEACADGPSVADREPAFVV